MNLKETIAFWERIMASITFAEANEHETARQLLENNKTAGFSKLEALKEKIHETSGALK